MELVISDLVVIAAAPFVGSFIGLAVSRRGSGETIVWGRSRCRGCARTLAVPEIVPIAGWVTARGRCRSCDAPIGFLYPAVEVLALALAAWAVAVAPGWFGLLGAALGWTLLALAVVDMREMVLPDMLTVPLIAAGLLVAAAIGSPVDHLLGAAVGGLGFAAIGFAWEKVTGREALGLGDAKLFAAAGAWLGWQGLPSVLLIASLLGLAAATVRGWNGAGLRDPLPFGPALAAGFWLVWAHGPVQIA